jgi:hypothetical protein
MSTEGKEKPIYDTLSGRDPSPEEVFAKIKEMFQVLGILGESLSVEHEGNRYRVTCDEQSFMVYRVSENNGLRHHVPGWPVCLVNSHTIFEESCSPELGRDHCACGRSIEGWLEEISSRFQCVCGG